MSDATKGLDAAAVSDAAMQAVVEAANRFVGQLLDEGQPTAQTHWAFQADSDCDRFAECELAWIADGWDPLRIAMHVAILQTAREVIQTRCAIRALPETPREEPGGRDDAGVTGPSRPGGRSLL